MITLKKLGTLKSGTRLRKIVRLLEEAERALAEGSSPDEGYVRGLIAMMTEDGALSEALRQASSAALSGWDGPDPSGRRRLINGLRHRLLSQLEIAQADWDFIHPGDRGSGGARRFFPGTAVYLDEIRSPFNVGSVFRTAESLGSKRFSSLRERPTRLTPVAVGPPWAASTASPGSA